MYKTLIAVLILACMVGCGAQPTGSQSTPSSSMTQSEAASSSQTVENSQAEPTPSPVAASSTDNSTSAGSQPTQTPAPDATAEPPENTEQNNETGGSDAATTAYGAVPFEYAAGTDKWWYIDSSDTAYLRDSRSASTAGRGDRVCWQHRKFNRQPPAFRGMGEWGAYRCNELFLSGLTSSSQALEQNSEPLCQWQKGSLLPQNRMKLSIQGHQSSFLPRNSLRSTNAATNASTTIAHSAMGSTGTLPVSSCAAD